MRLYNTIEKQIIKNNVFSKGLLKFFKWYDEYVAYDDTLYMHIMYDMYKEIGGIELYDPKTKNSAIMIMDRNSIQVTTKYRGQLNYCIDRPIKTDYDVVKEMFTVFDFINEVID